MREHSIGVAENFQNLQNHLKPITDWFITKRWEMRLLLPRFESKGLRDYGAALSPFNAFQIIQGLETLQVRVQKHSENALALAQWLEKQDAVAWVNYPGLKSSKYYDLATQYLPKGQNGLLTFGLKNGFEAAKKVADETKSFSLSGQHWRHQIIDYPSGQHHAPAVVRCRPGRHGSDQGFNQALGRAGRHRRLESRFTICFRKFKSIKNNIFELGKTEFNMF